MTHRIVDTVLAHTVAVTGAGPSLATAPPATAAVRSDHRWSGGVGNRSDKVDGATRSVLYDSSVGTVLQADRAEMLAEVGDGPRWPRTAGDRRAAAG